MASISPKCELSHLYELDYPSKTQYTDKSFPKDPKKSLHYLIALGQSAPYIQKLAAQYKESNPHYLTFQDSKNYHLTPLALATIYGRVDVVDILLQQGVKADIQDSWGFTCLHHAALLQNSSEMLTHLVEKIKALSSDVFTRLRGMRSVFGGTYEDIHRLASPPIDNPNDSVCLLKDKKQRTRELTRAEFHKITGRHFVSWFRCSPQNIIDMHRRPPHPDRKFYLDPHHPSVTRFEKHSPSLALRNYQGMGHGVEALEKIEGKEIALFYSGELLPPITDHLASLTYTYGQSIYRMNESNAEEYCNLGSCINDGPPNCYFKSIRDYKGVSGAKIMVASRTIQPREQLFAEYGEGHVTKLGIYEITEEAFKFLSDFLLKYHGNLSLLLTEVVRLRESPDYEYHMLPCSLLRYIFYTPAIFVKLHLLKILDADDTLKILHSESLIETVPVSSIMLDPSKPFQSYETPLRCLLRIQAHSNHGKLVPLIDSFISKIRADHLLEILSLIEENNLTEVEEVQKCGILGMLLDCIYLFFNDTLVGTYINKVARENEQFPQIKLEEDKICAAYVALSKVHQIKVLQYIQRLIRMDDEYINRPSKSQPLRHLCDSLIRISK